jgi:hypothetical protein
LPGQVAERALFIGDSHMEQYWPRAKFVSDQGRSRQTAEFATYDGCPPIPSDWIAWDGTHCKDVYAATMALSGKADVRDVVYGAYWKGYPPEVANKASLEKWGQDIGRLTQQGKTVWVLLSHPIGKEFHPFRMIGPRYDYLLGRRSARPLNRDVDRAQLQAAREPMAAEIGRIARLNGARVVDPFGYLCAPTSCPAQIDGHPVYKDEDHIRPFFIREHALFIDDILAGRSMSDAQPRQ